MTDALTQIRTLYFRTTKATVERDFDAAIDLLKSMATEDERDRAAVYMEGLAQMKSQWAAGGGVPHIVRPQAVARYARPDGWTVDERPGRRTGTAPLRSSSSGREASV